MSETFLEKCNIERKFGILIMNYAQFRAEMRENESERAEDE